MWPFRQAAPSRASQIKIKPPVRAKKQKALAIVIIARNEAFRIGDWLSFHAIAGASHIILYDNGSTDETATIARSFTGCPVTVIPWQFESSEAKTGMIIPRQILSYVHAICNFGAGFKKMAFIDADEFLVPVDAPDLPTALAQVSFPNISLPWTMFGHSGHEQPPEDALVFAFTQRAREAAGPLLNFKCIVDPCEVSQVSTHKFRTRQDGDLTRNTLGQTARNSQRTGSFVTTEVIQLNHYYLMSRHDMLLKLRGPAVSGVGQAQRSAAIQKKAELIESHPVEDLRAITFLNRRGIVDTNSLRNHYLS